MGKATAQAAALGHRLGRPTIVPAGRPGNRHITIRGAGCGRRGDAEVFVKLAARLGAYRPAVAVGSSCPGRWFGPA